MTKILYHPKFLKEFRKLPKPIRVKLAELESLFKSNPFYPGLHTKKLAGPLKILHSFRITRDYRVVFTFTSKDEAAFLSVRHRKDIYKNI